MSDNYKTRDRTTTRNIHKLFWRANSVAWQYMAISYAVRPLAMLAYNVFIPLAVAYGIQAIVDRNMHDVYKYAWEIFALAIAYCVFWALGAWLIHRNGAVGAVYLQKTVYANYLQKDSEFYANTYLGSLGAQISQLRDSYIQYCQLMTLAIPKQLIIVVAGIIVIAWNSLQLAAVTAVMMIAVLSYTLWSSRWRLKWRRQVSEASSEVGGLMSDALSHGATVKSFATEEYEQERIAPAMDRWKWAQYRSWGSAVPADVGRMILAAAATSLLLIMTARLYINGTINLAIVALIQLYVIKLVTATLDIAEIIKTYEATMGGAYQAVNTMLIEPTILDPEKPAKIKRSADLTVDFKHASYKYDEMKDGHNAVDDLNLTVRAGEKVGLVGYSGSGKTTLTKLLLRFMDVTSGSIELAGIDIRNMNQADVRRLVAYVPQEPLLFHRSIAENIAYGRPKATKKELLAAVNAAYVNEFAKELPKGIDTLVGERGIKLSGGQRQRVAIGRALLKDAPILVLDEATSALDSRSEKLIQSALWRLMKGRTAIVIAHRLSTIQRMDRIVVMDKGKIVQVGTHDELLKQPKGAYAKLWAHQSGGYVGVSTAEAQQP